jgi:hypothetical protein
MNMPAAAAAAAAAALTADALSRLDPDRVTAYLAANGWEQVESPAWLRAGSCWEAADGAGVLVPDPSLRDTPARWRDLVGALAHVEERDPAEVYADLLVTPLDRAAAADPVCRATAQACTTTMARLRQLALEIRAAAGTGHPPDAAYAADLRRAAGAAAAAVIANATAAAELVRFGATTVVADPAAGDEPPF